MKCNNLYFHLMKDDNKTFYEKELKIKEEKGNMISNEKFYINDKESYKKFINKKDKEVIVKKVEPVKGRKLFK